MVENSSKPKQNPPCHADMSALDHPYGDARAAREIAELGKAAGLTYLPPRNPAVLGEIWH